MKRTVVLLAVAALAWSVPIVCHSSQITVSPSSDGSLYTCTGCTVVSDGAYVLVSGYIQGAVKFPTAAIPEAITQAILTLNPYGLPLFGEVIDVYGYGTALGQLDETDANAGTFLGALVVPDDIGYGDDIAFDVTAFVLGTEAPFIAFNVRSAGLDVFSSLEFNYGHPSQLLVTAEAPEPASMVLMISGLLAAGTLMRRRTAAATRPQQRSGPRGRRVS
jgi:hypothetical protein